MCRRIGYLKQYLSAVWLSVLVGFAGAAEYQAGPEDYRSILPRLVAGDRLSLSAGDYRQGLPLHRISGEPGRLILIEGPPQGPGARFIARKGANTVSLVDVSYLHIRNLELDGNNLPVDAVKAEGHARFAHFVTLENLNIHDHASSQQNVGISTKCPALGWVIRGNRIERVGTGMYLGNSDGNAPFVGGLIEGNQVTHTVGYNLQIKHQNPRPTDLPEVNKPHVTLIRGNLFSKSDSLINSPPGPMARPNVLIGDLPSQGAGRKDRTLIYRNLFWQNTSESLFQGEGNLALYNNIFVTHGPAAIRIQPHNGVPRDVQIFQNTVLATGDGIFLRTPENNAFTQVVDSNVVVSPHPISGADTQGNVTLGFDSAGGVLVQPFADLRHMDLSPRHNLVVQKRGVLDSRRTLPDFNVDFFGRPRLEHEIGAIGQSGATPLSVWLSRAGFNGDGL